MVVACALCIWENYLNQPDGSLCRCGWDGKANKMIDSEPKKLYAALPVMHVTGKLAKDNVTKNTFEAPCYRVKKRTGLNFISTFQLRTEDHPSKWILRGVALLCSVD